MKRPTRLDLDLDEDWRFYAASALARGLIGFEPIGSPRIGLRSPSLTIFLGIPSWPCVTEP